MRHQAECDLEHHHHRSDADHDAVRRSAPEKSERNCAYAEKANDPNDAWSTSSKFSRIVSYFSLFSSSFPPSLVPKMKRVGEDDVAKKIVPGSIVEVESGIHLEIAGDVAGKADRR